MKYHATYSRFKESNVAWLGEIPKHWSVTRFKYLFDLNPTKSAVANRRYALCSFLPMEKLKTDTIVLDEIRVVDEVYEGYSYFSDGDILIAKVTPCFENRNIAVAADLTNRIGFGSTEINVIRAKSSINTRFLYYRLQEDQFRRIAISEMTGTGGLKRVPSELFQVFKVAIPPYNEQAVISAEIDKEIERIDKLVSKKNKFVELLKEKRQALITHSVTTGIVKNANLQESGIKWVEQVPSHWEVVPGIWLFAESKETAREDDQHLSATQKYGVIPLSEYERLENRQVTHAIKNLEKRKHVELDDFVISMRSFQGGIERVKARGCVRSSYVVLKASDEADVDYFAYLFKSSAYIQGLQATSSFIRDGQDLNYGNFRQVKLPKPPLEEQKRIAQYLNQQTARIDALIEKTQHSVALLTERRAAFITAAVTGQIDLRGEE
ncbi:MULTISPECIES: restriction endonuclease subunit S [Alteromonadales]|jgi:type I restriction enzyme S subunit|uniref:Type I restriction enzyme, S subunit n=1 Tax=Paraglaciecola polaris LMG 21857 TaxID=1129793 RepID=K6YF57_9ALTE|nr:restriction endonuclease subunit S [Paraglaciecola polaris]OZB04575.1 MAG: type I restriction endonuclease [Idiomarina sp. 34-48-12]GAC31359.1 type I restriction enzyme, S subunit [Paraglaciecola polaris LMG 21857]